MKLLDVNQSTVLCMTVNNSSVMFSIIKYGGYFCTHILIHLHCHQDIYNAFLTLYSHILNTVQEINWMAFAERVWIKCNWENISDEDKQWCVQLTNDFAFMILKQDLSLFQTDYSHLLEFIKHQHFITLNLHCEGLKISVDQIPFQCFVVKYNVNHV